ELVIREITKSGIQGMDCVMAFRPQPIPNCGRQVHVEEKAHLQRFRPELSPRAPTTLHMTKPDGCPPAPDRGNRSGFRSRRGLQPPAIRPARRLPACRGCKRVPP